MQISIILTCRKLANVRHGMAQAWLLELAGALHFDKLAWLGRYSSQSSNKLVPELTFPTWQPVACLTQESEHSDDTLVLMEGSSNWSTP